MKYRQVETERLESDVKAWYHDAISDDPEDSDLDGLLEVIRNCYVEDAT